MENKWQLCVCGAIRCGNEYLMVQRNPQDENMAGFWEMPSGKAEFGEKAEEALIREVNEEVGINISGFDRKIIGVSEYCSSKNQIAKYSVQLNYLIDVPTKDIPIKLSDEHIAFSWTTREDPIIDEFIGEIINDAERTYPNNCELPLVRKRKF